MQIMANSELNLNFCHWTLGELKKEAGKKQLYPSQAQEDAGALARKEGGLRGGERGSYLLAGAAGCLGEGLPSDSTHPKVS